MPRAAFGPPLLSAAQFGGALLAFRTSGITRLPLGNTQDICSLEDDTQRLLSIQPHLTQSLGLRLNPSVSWTS
jgi:hypothetical protein